MLTEDQRQHLIQIALNTRQWAYAPYSKYPVGAALLTASGRIYEGVNVENAAYPNGICAERVALFKAVSEGELQFEAIAVASRNGGAPCGACRQALAEFGQNTIILIVDETEKILHETTVRELLPLAFGSEKLNSMPSEGAQ